MYNKKGLLKFLIILSITISGLFIIKYKLHKNEINELLEVKDIIELTEEEDLIDSSGDEESTTNNKEQENNIINKKAITASYEVKKIKNTSENVSKKSKKSMDFININNNNYTFNNDNDEFEYNNSDYDLLARLIYSEAGNQPYQGKVAVGNVVLYRSMQNNLSIRDVIFAKGQFDGVHTENFNIEPNDESKLAAKEVLAGKKIVENGYFFANLKLCSPNWAKKETFIMRIGDHWFFRRE